MRILFIAGMFFSAGMLLLVGWYVPQLRQLTETPERHETTKINPLTIFSELFKKTPLYTSLIGKITLMQQAKVLYDQMSVVSFYVYCLTHLVTLCTLWYFILMQRCFKKIAYS